MATAPPAPSAPSASEAAASPELARARLQGKRAALAAVIAVTVAFIGWSAVQVIPQVFGVDVRPLPPAAPGSADGACAEGVRRLALALDRPAVPAMVGEPAPLPGEWQEAPAVERACGGSAEGEQAWAALLRLRSAEEQLGPRHPSRAELEPLRRDVAAHLPPDLR
jgi:hypothetical protein